jgi:hypothetical protein
MKVVQFRFSVPGPHSHSWVGVRSMIFSESAVAKPEAGHKMLSSNVWWASPRSHKLNLWRAQVKTCRVTHGRGVQRLILLPLVALQGFLEPNGTG